MAKTMDVVLCHLVEVACELISARVAVGGETRQTVTYALSVLPLLNAELAATARNDARFAWVVFYSRSLESACRARIFEFAPPSLRLDGGHTHGYAVDDPTLKKKTVAEISESLYVVQTNLETARRLKVSFTLKDVPATLPVRVKIFVSQIRGLFKALRRIKTKNCFTKCSTCRRGHYKSSLTSDPKHGAEDASVYAELCAGPSTGVGKKPTSFCSGACACAWRRSIERFVGVPRPSILLNSRERTSAHGRARVSVALAAALKRNADYRRTLSKAPKPPESICELVLSERERRVRSLNIDVGLLYCSSVLAVSRSLAGNRILAGAAEGWRSRAIFFAKPIKTINKHYELHHRDRTRVLSNLLTEHPDRGFVAKLRTTARTVFA